MSNTKTEVQRLADELRSHVQTYPQMSEDEPGGYCSQDDQLMDEAATELLSLDAQNKAIHKIIDQLRAQLSKAVTSKCELLKALDLMEKAQAHIDGLPMFPTTHATEGARFKLFDARQAARAAIAKATGEHHE